MTARKTLQLLRTYESRNITFIEPDGSWPIVWERARGVYVWDANGKHLGTILMPEQPANLAWGGKDLRTLYITATTSVYKLETHAQGFVPYMKKAK